MQCQIRRFKTKPTRVRGVAALDHRMIGGGRTDVIDLQGKAPGWQSIPPPRVSSLIRQDAPEPVVPRGGFVSLCLFHHLQHGCQVPTSRPWDPVLLLCHSQTFRGKRLSDSEADPLSSPLLSPSEPSTQTRIPPNYSHIQPAPSYVSAESEQTTHPAQYSFVVHLHCHHHILPRHPRFMHSIHVTPPLQQSEVQAAIRRQLGEGARCRPGPWG